jgi:hypothetical protein
MSGASRLSARAGGLLVVLLLSATALPVGAMGAQRGDVLRPGDLEELERLGVVSLLHDTCIAPRSDYVRLTPRCIICGKKVVTDAACLVADADDTARRVCGA